MKKVDYKKYNIKKLVIGLILLLVGIAVYILIFTYNRTFSEKKFVDYLRNHIDEAAADFAEYEIAFSAAEAADVLLVKDSNNRYFYYQSSKGKGDQLIKIECDVMKKWGSEILAGKLEIQKSKEGYAYVVIENDDEEHFEIRSLIYSVPEFDKYENRHRNSATTAQRISQWISTKQLSAIYKEGKEFEEIFSEYCKETVVN